MKKPETDLRTRAINLLARREYSRAELAYRLGPYCDDRDQIDALLDDLERRGWLSDQRFVEQIVHARRGRYGSLRVAHELREKGVAEGLVREAVEDLKGDELAAARAVWARKFGELPKDAKEKAKQMRFLASRGFGHEVIRKVLQQRNDD